jgi:hypothetical protein
MRFAQGVSFCHAGFGTKALHPLPPDDQADSAQPRLDADVFSVVPPTATTWLEVAGYWAA